MDRFGACRVIAFGCAVATSAPAARADIVRAPYLQSPSPTEVSVRWRTDTLDQIDSRVWLGADPAQLEQTFGATAAAPPSNPAVIDHEVRLTGLSPSTRYYYAVGSVSVGIEAGGTEAHHFVTPPAIGEAEPLSIWVVGDSGSNSAAQHAVRDAMSSVMPNGPDLFLHVGDIAYQSGTDAEFTTNHFGVYANILQNTPFWPAIGNHEASTGASDSGSQFGPYYEAFSLPTRGQAGGKPTGTEAYYAFDYGDIHFIVLDSDDSSVSPGSAQIQWLSRELSGLPATQRWLIAMFHHPPYSKGSHDSDRFADSGGRLVAMREHVLPLLEAAGVDLVLAGHSHIYERSFLVDSVYGYGECPDFATPDLALLEAEGKILDSGSGQMGGDGAYEKPARLASHAGTVYVVAGHGGKDPSGAANHPVMYFSELANGSCVITVDNDTLVLQNVRSDGVISDEFAIVKSLPACSDAAVCDDGLRCTQDECVDGACVNAPVTCALGEECNEETGDCEVPTRTVSFRHAARGYELALDAVIREATPSVVSDPMGGLTWDSADPNGSGSDAFTLIRFDGLFESRGGPIPDASEIRFATLEYTVFNAGNLGDVYEVSHTWDAGVTFDSFGAAPGVDAEDLGEWVGEAPGALALNTVDVTASLQSWSQSPADNHGWVIVPNGPNGTTAYASEAASEALRPLLSVEFVVERCADNDDCDDGNACTLDSCDEGTCASVARSCDDGSACTIDDCEPDLGCTHAVVDCDDGNACTNNTCAPEPPRCAAEVLGCDGGDTCFEAGCVTTDVVCADGNVCTDDTCDPATGCSYTQNTSACDDGDLCTSADRCSSGVCSGQLVDCSAEASECQIAQCSAASGGCLLLPVVDGTPCARGVCVGGACVSYDASGFDPPGAAGDAGGVSTDPGTPTDAGGMDAGQRVDASHDAPSGFDENELRVRGGCACRVEGLGQTLHGPWCLVLLGLLWHRRTGCRRHRH